jgi:MFS family permease
VLGVTISAGLIIGMYTTGFTLAQTVAVIPLAWSGDRYDKRLVLLAVLGVGVFVYAGTEMARGGLAVGATAVAVTVTAEKATNMVGQLFTGRLSDVHGRSLFVFAGGGAYGLIAIAIPLSTQIGTLVGTGITLPVLGELPVSYIPLVLFSGLLGVADSFREPASMALFADEGNGDGSIASSFGIRELVWRPGSVAGPLVAGWLMVEVSMASVFYVGGAFAITGVLTFLGILVSDHGRQALTKW